MFKRSQDYHFITSALFFVFSQGTNSLILTPGDFFGHESLLYGMKQTYSVKTIKNSGFYVLHRLDIGEIHENDPYFARELEEALEISILRQSKKRKDTNQQQSDSEKLSVDSSITSLNSTPSNQPRARY
jgi:hypothetical protein